MNKLVRNIFIFILIIVFIMAFSNSYLSLSIDNLAYILAIGIDKADENNLLVTFQFSTTTQANEAGTAEKAPAIINSVKASSISSAINLLNGYVGKQLNMSHCKIIIFSEEFALDGISEEVYTLINDTQVRPSANIVISKCPAKDYIENTSPELENLISKYYEIFTNSSQYTGFTADSTIGKFFNNLICTTYQPTAILGGLTSDNLSDESNSDYNKNYNIKSNTAPIEGENGSENIGIAAFHRDKIVGELDALESIAFLTLNNNINRFLVSIPDPINSGRNLDIYLSPKNSPSVKVDTSSSSPFINVSLDFSGQIYSMSDNSEYLKPEVLDTISESCKQYLETLFLNYLYKTSKELKSDINGLGKYALKNFFNTQEFDSYNWHKNYQNAFFKVDINSIVKSGMLITDT